MPQEQFDSGTLLGFLELLRHRVENLVGFGEVGTFGGDIAVVEAVVWYAEFLHELERDIHAALAPCRAFRNWLPRVGQHIRVRTGRRPCRGRCASSRRRTAGDPASTSFDDFVGVVVPVRERVLAFGAFVLDLGNVGEERHGSRFG